MAYVARSRSPRCAAGKGSPRASITTGRRSSAFLRRNPGFRPGQGRAPLILIGAGTGIGPLAGFVRSNAGQRPVHLFFGMRHPDSDFFYGEDLRA